jgi:uncharacterized sulfatase
MGDPYHRETGDTPDVLASKSLANTGYSFPDLDASPTKTWIMLRENEAQWSTYWDYAFGKRSGEELYDLRSDRDYLVNVAEKPEYADIRQNLSQRLMSVLTSTGDPRVTGDGQTYEKSPFAGPGTLDNSER